MSILCKNCVYRKKAYYIGHDTCLKESLFNKALRICPITGNENGSAHLFQYCYIKNEHLNCSEFKELSDLNKDNTDIYMYDLLTEHGIKLEFPRPHGPSKNGSKYCESGSIASGGKREYCTCDYCY